MFINKKCNNIKTPKRVMSPVSSRVKISIPQVKEEKGKKRTKVTKVEEAKLLDGTKNNEEINNE